MCEIIMCDYSVTVNVKYIESFLWRKSLMCIKHLLKYLDLLFIFQELLQVPDKVKDLVLYWL